MAQLVTIPFTQTAVSLSNLTKLKAKNSTESDANSSSKSHHQNRNSDVKFQDFLSLPKPPEKLNSNQWLLERKMLVAVQIGIMFLQKKSGASVFLK